MFGRISELSFNEKFQRYTILYALYENLSAEEWPDAINSSPEFSYFWVEKNSNIFSEIPELYLPLENP